MRRLTYIIIFLALCEVSKGQRNVALDLWRTVQLATDSSMTAQKYQSVFDKSKWDYMAYRAKRKPQISLETTPAQHYQYLVQRYLSDQNIDEYRQQRLFQSTASVKVTQNFEPLGGYFYGSTGLGYLKSYGEYNYSQFTTIPILIGYKQELFGFNALKWQKRIEPLKMESAQKTLSYNKENMAAEATKLFFNLAIAQSSYQMAEKNKGRCDTLYEIGKRKFNIASISKGELLVLEIDCNNARNSLTNSEIQLNNAMNELAMYLNMEEGTQLHLIVPSITKGLTIDVYEALRYAQENNPTYLKDRQMILEAQRDIEKAKIESKINIGFDVRIGLNQVDHNLWYAYGHQLMQDYAVVNLSIPLKDWGLGKFKVNAANSTLLNAQTTADIDSRAIEREVRRVVEEFNVQQQIVENNIETREMAGEAYNNTFQLFMTGKASVNDITLAQNRWQTAEQNYISALKNYWECYFKVRKVTLHDFLEKF